MAAAVTNGIPMNQCKPKSEKLSAMNTDVHCLSAYDRSEFKEIEEVNKIIANLCNIFKDQIEVEMALERFLFIVDLYQEQPHLLDPHLESLLESLLAIVRNTESQMDLIHLAFRFLYILTKARGYKVIVRLMPHEVADLEPVLALLGNQDPQDHENWATRYMLLLWLAIVSMIPFDMVRLDSNIRSQTGETRQPIMERIIQAGQRYLCVSDKSRDASAYMLSRFMTRPDVKAQQLPAFLDWTLQILHKADRDTLDGMVSISGALTVIALLFKHGKREDLIDYAPTILERLNTLKMGESNNIVLRKLHTKLVQRLGLTLLKSRIAAWRYQRGSRSLTTNLAVKTPSTSEAVNTQLAEGDDEDYEIPDEIEDIIEYLLKGLKDKDTIVRWSAAKGIGRVTGRLPKELADEVVGSLMGLFTVTESDGAWHGGCLALAELGRRGLLVPERLPEVVPVILKALTYDEKRGTFSVGTHVRDAACYVCWAFARAYDPEELLPHVNQIASALVILFIYDREVNVRRAAAAAFQEHVGRQGQFPHGIDILTTCDFFSVGLRTHCYLELSVYVSQFEQYTKDLIDHLVDVKINHWDIAIRELAAEALYNLTPRSPEYMAKTVIPKLISKVSNMELSLRHGSIISIAEITHALHQLALKNNQSVTSLLDAADVHAMKCISAKLQDAKLFRGLGGEIMRKGVCCLIEKLSLSKMPFHGDAVIDLWLEIIQDCLQHIEPEVQAAGIKPINAFFSEYYKTPSGTVNQIIQEKVLKKFLGELKAPVETTRMGYALAIGSFSKFFVLGHLDSILNHLCSACLVSEKEPKWAEARRDAVKALASICMTVRVSKEGKATEGLCKDNIPHIYSTLFKALDDYTLDSKGDVGAWVREASMQGLCDLTSLLIKEEPSLVSDSIIERLFCHIAQQASEKIDRTRACAGSVLTQLLYHNPDVSGVPHRVELQNIFPKEEAQTMNWAVPSVTFPKVTQLLPLETYSYNTLLGLTVSVGGLTESLVKHSAASLLAYLKENTKSIEDLDKFSTVLLKIFKDHQRVDRISLPMFKMLDQLLSNGCFDLYADNPENSFAPELLRLSKEEIKKCGDPQKLLGSIDVFCGLLVYPGDVRKKSLSQLLVFMCHRYPIVRRTTSSKLYEAVVTYDEIVDEEALDEVMTLLSETQWDEPLTVVRPIRNKLCDLLHIQKPVIQKQSKSEKGDGDKKDSRMI